MSQENSNNPEEQQAPQEGAPKTGDQFLKEVAQPTNAAQVPANIDLPPAGPSAGNTPPPPPPPGQQNQPPDYRPPAGGQPIFNPNEPPPGPVVIPPTTSKEVMDKTLTALLELENTVSAIAFSAYAKEEDFLQFKRDKATTLEIVEIVPDHYKQWVMKYCPDLLPAMGIYLIDKFKTRTAAIKLRKVNIANARAAEDDEVMDTVRSKVAQKGERKNFAIADDGYYKNDRNGKYITDRDGKNKKKLERPRIEDIDRILALNTNRDREKLAAAFNWTETDFNRHNIPAE